MWELGFSCLLFPPSSSLLLFLTTGFRFRDKRLRKHVLVRMGWRWQCGEGGVTGWEQTGEHLSTGECTPTEGPRCWQQAQPLAAEPGARPGGGKPDRSNRWSQPCGPVRGPQSPVLPQRTKQVTHLSFFFSCCWFSSLSTSGNTYTLRKTFGMSGENHEFVSRGFTLFVGNLALALEKYF